MLKVKESMRRKEKEKRGESSIRVEVIEVRQRTDDISERSDLRFAWLAGCWLARNLHMRSVLFDPLAELKARQIKRAGQEQAQRTAVSSGRKQAAGAVHRCIEQKPIPRARNLSIM